MPREPGCDVRRVRVISLRRGTIVGPVCFLHCLLRLLLARMRYQHPIVRIVLAATFAEPDSVQPNLSSQGPTPKMLYVCCYCCVLVACTTGDCRAVRAKPSTPRYTTKSLLCPTTARCTRHTTTRYGIARAMRNDNSSRRASISSGHIFSACVPRLR